MIIVTGGAGFIGSNLLGALEAAGAADLVVCDQLLSGNKWRNIAKRSLRDIVTPDAILAYIDTHAGQIETIFHLGAISSTTATDGDEVVKANFSFSVALWQACARHGIAFIYASSAAAYGDGAHGFTDSNDLAAHRRLRPLNLYGWSKWLFDGWVLQSVERGLATPAKWAGLRFFNVFGPNEYHKGTMQSLVAKIVTGHVPGVPVRLFKSYRADFADGWQLRDFIAVDDVIAAMLWLDDRPGSAGILNLGTGVARSFHDLAVAAVQACGDRPVIEYADMPQPLRSAYQYYTCADMRRLRGLGYDRPFTPLEDAVTRYAQDYLLAPDRYR